MAKRAPAVLLPLFCAVLLAAEGASGYKKAYFGLTKPGTFAKYTMKMPGFRRRMTQLRHDFV